MKNILDFEIHIPKTIENRIATYLTVVLTLTIVLHGLFAEFLSPLSHDVSWLLYIARNLNDSRLYVDFYENNPPLAVWLYWVPMQISKLLPLSDVNTLRLLVSFLAVLVFWLSWGVLSRLFTERKTFLAVFIIFLAAGVTIISYGEFGQREHLILLAILPYLLSVVALSKGQCISRFARNTIVILLAAAICLKPFYVFVWVFLEIFLAIRVGRFASLLRNENWAILVLGLLYCLSVLIFSSEYYTFMLPLTLETYWGYRSPLPLLLARDNELYLLLGLFIASGCLIFNRMADKDWVLPLLLGMLGTYVAYLLGGTPWSYHIMPFMVMAFALLVYLVISLVMNYRTNVGVNDISSRRKWGSVVAVFCLVPVFHHFVMTNFNWFAFWGGGMKMNHVREAAWSKEPHVSENAKGAASLLRFQNILIEHTRDNKSIFALNVYFSPVLKLIGHLDVEWASRFHVPWILPGIIKVKLGEQSDALPLSRANELSDFYRESVLTDLQAKKPALILVDRSLRNAYMPVNFDFMAYMELEPGFVKLMEQYSLLTTEEYGVRQLAIYKRNVDQP
jgi:hypothetical protein